MSASAPLPSDSWLAEQLAWAYGYSGFGTPGETYPWDYQLPGDSVRGGIRRFPELGIQLRLWPGTEDPHEWLLNVSAWPETTQDHPQLGKMPWGFLEGLETASALLDAELDPGLGVVDVAHSRGCPHAVVNALISQVRSRWVLLMGSPRPGTMDLVRAWQGARIPGISYRTVNLHDRREVDVVTKVPFYVPGAAPFCPVMPWTDLEVQPDPNDRWMMLALHHEDTMYLPGIKAREGAGR